MQLLTWVYLALGVAMWTVCATARLATPRANAAFGVASFLMLMAVVPLVFYKVAAHLGCVVSLENQKLAYPVTDAMTLTLVVGTFVRNPRLWKGLMIAILTGLIISHAAFWTIGHGSVHALWAYTAIGNVAFVAQVAILMSTGFPHARRGVADLVRGPRLRRFSPPVGRASAGYPTDAGKREVR